MLKDPLYRAIEAGLQEPLDPELFERCAADLLRSSYPGLVPVRGGGDAGMDGAIGEPGAAPSETLTAVFAPISNTAANAQRLFS